MPEEFLLDEDGRAVAVHRRVTVRTPGLAGRAIVHEAAWLPGPEAPSRPPTRW